MTLELALLALMCGALGGWGGRFWALWSLRREVHALAAAVDPALSSKLAQALAELQAHAGALDALASGLKSVHGRFGAEEKKARQLTPEDAEFLTNLVIGKLQQQMRPRAAG